MPAYEKKLTNDQAREILRMFYEDGIGVGTLDLLFPVSKSTIYAILQGRAYYQHGFNYGRFPYNRPPANTKRTAEAVETARRMREGGATYKQIAEKVGVHLVTVRDWLVK
jgi:DNA invertase Pin-like site-specific DNA recombinase